MMTTAKIQNTHCERIAFVYVRQSTWLQVMENRESTERQYNLRQRAIELGWPPNHRSLPHRIPALGGGSSLRQGRNGADARGIATGAQQQRLVSTH